MPKDRVLLIVEDEWGKALAPFPLRLRRFLKAALRSYGIRCRWVQDASNWTFGDEPQQTEALDLDAETGERGKVGAAQHQV